MDCQEVQSKTIDGLLNNLDVFDQPKTKEHLDQCQICNRVVDELKRVYHYYEKSFKQVRIPSSLPVGFVSRGYEKIRLRKQKSRRDLIYKTVAAAAVILIGLVSYFLLTTSQSHILEGVLYVEREGETIICKELLPIGQTLKTKESQSAKIRLRDNSIIKLAPNTILTVKHDSRLNGRLLSFEEGELYCQVSKGSGFRIQMPGAELKTLGTEFALRMSTNKKEIITSRNKPLSFITSATVKVSVSSGRVLLTTNQLQREIRSGETVIRDVNPPLPVELQTEIKELINQLGNENELIRQEAFAKLVEIGYVSVPFLEELLPLVDSIQQSYINQLLEKFIRPKILWSYEIPDVGFALHPPVVSEDQLFIVDGSGLYALDCLQGSVNWKFQQDDFNSAPLVVDGVVYIGTLGGCFFAIESKEGKIIWQQTGLVGIQSIPAIFNDTIYIGAGEPDTNHGRFYALDVYNKIKWVFSTQGIIAGSQAVIFNNKLVLFGDCNHKLYALNAQTGELVWEYQTGGRIVTSPWIDKDNNLVYFGSWDGNLYALSVWTGEKQWVLQTDSAIIESPVKVGSILYWGTKHKIYAFNLEKCIVAWTYNRERSTVGTITVSEGRVYLGTDAGRVIALDTTIGQELWGVLFDNDLADCFYKVTSCPTIFNGVLYIVSRSVGDVPGNKIYALKLK